MATRITVEKYSPQAGEYWVNVYYVFAPWDSQTATDAAYGILSAEQNITYNSVIFTKMRIDDRIVGTDSYRTIPINVPGLKSGGSALFPLFNVARFDLQTGQGRPSRKYLRGVLAEADVDFLTFSSAFIANAQDYGTGLTTITALCDLDDQLIQNVTISLTPGMRQLRRGSKKNVIPL